MPELSKQQERKRQQLVCLLQIAFNCDEGSWVKLPGNNEYFSISKHTADYLFTASFHPFRDKCFFFHWGNFYGENIPDVLTDNLRDIEREISYLGYSTF